MIEADRLIFLGKGIPGLPEGLLRAHAEGRVLFLCGAGISMPSGLPSFEKLTLDIFAALDSALHDVLDRYVKERRSNKQATVDVCGLNAQQRLEANLFESGQYDVALGTLERRQDITASGGSLVRQEVARLLIQTDAKPSPIHYALMRLANRGGMMTIATTNFDLLLEKAMPKGTSAPPSYALSSIPRPTLRSEFSGVFHIHGALSEDITRTTDIVLTEEDFGDFYLRRRSVPEFIYDAARIFTLVLVGYSASDPPMQYLLSALSADTVRFPDLRRPYAFMSSEGTSDPVEIARWQARGITPVHYDSSDRHSALLNALERWAALSVHQVKQQEIQRIVRRIVKQKRDQASNADRDLLDHLLRRSSVGERFRLVEIMSKVRADTGWLDAALELSREGHGNEYLSH